MFTYQLLTLKPACSNGPNWKYPPAQSFRSPTSRREVALVAPDMGAGGCLQAEGVSVPRVVSVPPQEPA